MQVWFIFSLIFSLIVAAFAVLNSEIVTIKFLGMNYELSQSAVILISAVFGAAIAMFLGLFGKIKSNIKNSELTNSLKNAEKEIELLSDSVKNYEQKASVYSSGNTATAEKKPTDSDHSEDPPKE